MKDFDPKIKIVSFGDNLDILLPGEIPNYQIGDKETPTYPKIPEYKDEIYTIVKSRFEELNAARRWKEVMISFGIESWDKYHEPLSFLKRKKNA